MEAHARQVVLVHPQKTKAMAWAKIRTDKQGTGNREQKRQTRGGGAKQGQLATGHEARD